MPIIGTIIGTGLLEGGSFVKLTPTVAAYGTSYRCNAESALQLAGLLRPLGIELVVVPPTDRRRLARGPGGTTSRTPIASNAIRAGAYALRCAWSV